MKDKIYKVIAFIVVGLLVVIGCLRTCVMKTPKSNSVTETELREFAHKNGWITPHEFMSGNKDNLPQMIVTDRTVLMQVAKTNELKEFGKISWSGNDFTGDFEYWAVFDISVGKDVCAAYLGVNYNTAKKLSNYIAPRGELEYFYSPILFVIDRVDCKNGIINQQCKVRGELIVLIADDEIVSDK